MPSTLTWLDHSDRDRRKVLEAIDRFKESDTRDELGLGTIRDAFADLFFPGTSTIQTRARYFLFVPWIYRELEKKGVGSDRIAARARQAEIKLVQALKSAGEDTGILGKLAGASLKRLPSSVYWLGLATWRIRQFAGSQDDYHRSLDGFYARNSAAAKDDDGELVEGRLRRNWHPDLPEPPSDFPEVATFRLERREARYLAERILYAAPGTLLDFLVRHASTVEADHPWTHPQLAAFPEPVRDALDHARNLAETMHGAALLYNLLLAEELPAGDRQRELVEEYRSALGDWATELSGRGPSLAAWDRTAFWALVRAHANVRQRTHDFVEQWVGLAAWSLAGGGADDGAARALIRHRESVLKGARARLGNPRALELWSGASGAGRLDYRWFGVKRIVRDIRAGLTEGGSDAGAR